MTSGPRPRDLDELASLRAKVRAMRLALAHLPGSLVGLYRVDGHCLLMEGTTFIGVSASEGKHYDVFVPAERRETFLRLFERAKRGLTTVADYPIGNLMFEATTKGLVDERGRVQYVFFFCRDVTGERAELAALAIKGGRDSLTGLPRRSVLQAHVDGLLRHGNPFHVVFMDLDNFKSVNDTLGHKTGDLVLGKAARAMQSTTRLGDLAVRLGGDEFVAVLSSAQSPEAAATRLRATILEAVAPFGVGVSMGIASFPDDGATLSELLAAADRAMYTAKAKGRGAR